MALWDFDSQDVSFSCSPFHLLLYLLYISLFPLVGHLPRTIQQWKKSIGATVSQSEALYKNAIAKNPKNMLALNHEPLETTVHQILPFAIKLLQSKGYKLVTLAECLGLPAYQWERAPGIPDVSLFCEFKSLGWEGAITDRADLLLFLSHHAWTILVDMALLRPYSPDNPSFRTSVFLPASHITLLPFLSPLKDL